MPEPVILEMDPSPGGGQQQPDADPSAAAPSPSMPGAPEAPPLPPPVAPNPRTGSGVGLLLAVTGATTGLGLGGLWGGIAGLLYAGATRNVYRAWRTWSSPDPSVHEEAVRSATAGAFGGLLAVFATVQASSAGKSDKED